MWKCSGCGTSNVRANEKCVYCFHRLHKITPRPEQSDYDEFDELCYSVRLQFYNNALFGDYAMNKKEELFAEYFNMELSSTMARYERGDFGPPNEYGRRLRLDEHIEKLASLAHEGKARFQGAAEARRRIESKERRTSDGFARSVEIDEFSTEAINKIEKRKEKMSKTEKLIQTMMKSGMDRKTAESLINAGTIISRLNSAKSAEVEKPKESAPFVNPFEALNLPKAEEKKVEVTVDEGSDTVVIEEVEKPKPTFVNPFDALGLK